MRFLPLFALFFACSSPEPPPPPAAVPADLDAHCRELIGEPRVEEPSPGVFVALGWDLANTILIRTDAGSVIVDAGMSPARARPVREALLAKSPGPIAAIVYTHSHIDHVGGASVWVEEGTEVWATDRFTGHFFKQYDRFLRAEATRAARQFGRDVPPDVLACSALGRAVDLDAALEIGARLPTRSFSGAQSLTIGGVQIELVEAHGETDDQLFVWLPAGKVLLPGDNWYRAFPNLYTIRGSRPRPVDAWIDSLDTMRRLEPEVLIPSHTGPLVGAAAIQDELRSYRDGIQWVRDAVVRGANAGRPLEAIVAAAALPTHLAQRRALKELYGQVDWSARAIYTNELGWFDGQAHRLYPLGPSERSRLFVDAMGGAESVRAAAAAADPAEAAELLALLQDHPDVDRDSLDAAFAEAYTALAARTPNSNGRGYLLQAAAERRGEVEAPTRADPGPGFVDGLPLDLLFATLSTRLKPEAARGVHESVRFDLGTDGAWTVTQRHGVAEVIAGDPLPGTPAPVATVTTDGATWRRISLQQLNPAGALADGRLSIEGPVAFARFMGRFDRALLAAPEVKP